MGHFGGEQFLVLLVVAVVVWLVVRNRSKNAYPPGSTAKNSADAGPPPDFTFNGNAFISLGEASDHGGDYGMKFNLAVFKKKRVIRLALRIKKEWMTRDVSFDAIEGVKRVVLKEGEYGTYPVRLVVITTDGEGFPLREIILYPGDYSLLDALSEALKSKEGNSSERDLGGAAPAASDDAAESIPSAEMGEFASDLLTDESIAVTDGPVTAGVLQAIAHLAERSPDRALAMIDREVTKNGEQLALRCARLTALRRLAMGPPRSVRGESHDVELAELRKRVCDQVALRRALLEIAEIEREDKEFFVSRLAFEEQLVDNVCVLSDRLEPGIVQKTLGWTKLLYFGVDRLGYMSSEIVGDGRAVRNMPRESYGKILRVRFRVPKAMRSANSLFGASVAGRGGWKIEYIVFERVKDSRERTVGDASLRGRLGGLDLWEDGSWIFKPSDDNERYVGGGPQFTD